MYTPGAPSDIYPTIAAVPTLTSLQTQVGPNVRTGPACHGPSFVFMPRASSEVPGLDIPSPGNEIISADFQLPSPVPSWRTSIWNLAAAADPLESGSGSPRRRTPSFISSGPTPHTAPHRTVLSDMIQLGPHQYQVKPQLIEPAGMPLQVRYCTSYMVAITTYRVTCHLGAVGRQDNTKQLQFLTPDAWFPRYLLSW